MLATLKLAIDDFNQLLSKKPTWWQSLFRDNNKSKKGCVYLVGAGVGDPELLTLKAHRLIQQADVILVDWLVYQDLYQYFPKKAECLFVGKRCGQHSLQQHDICELMRDKALSGATVVRLKGGDPSVFGRLGEETNILDKHQIPYAIVPGITAATGCAAYTGISLTHRNCAQSVKFITAHFKDEHQEPDWAYLAQDKDTLVFYMGLNRITTICQRLVANGMPIDTPVAVIDQGTTQQQLTIVGQLNTIADKMSQQKLLGPALIIIGQVVHHRAQVNLAMLAHASPAVHQSQ